MATPSELQKLREGNRVRYDRVLWQVESFSTYTDPSGYKTSEWLLKPETKAGKPQQKVAKALYLLREVDPASPDQVNWYLSEELVNPVIMRPPNTANCFAEIQSMLRSQGEPFPDLKGFYRNYFFESATLGAYRNNGIMSQRRTLDYWDATHQWNLAFEYWIKEDQLLVYSARLVSSDDFSDLDWSYQAPSDNSFEDFFKDQDNIYLMISVSLMIVGVLFLLGGI